MACKNMLGHVMHVRGPQLVLAGIMAFGRSSDVNFQPCTHSGLIKSQAPSSSRFQCMILCETANILLLPVGLKLFARSSTACRAWLHPPTDVHTPSFSPSLSQTDASTRARMHTTQARAHTHTLTREVDASQPLHDVSTALPRRACALWLSSCGLQHLVRTSTPCTGTGDPGCNQEDCTRESDLTQLATWRIGVDAGFPDHP